MKIKIILVLTIIMSFIVSVMIFADSENMSTAVKYSVGKNDLELYIGGLTAAEENTYYNPDQDNRLPDFPNFKSTPFGLKAMFSATIKDWSKPTVINYDCSYYDLHIESTLEIDTRYGDVNISIGNLSFGSNGHIVIRGSGKAYFYVKGDLNLSNGSSINSNGNFESLEIYHRGSKVKFQGGVGGNGRYKFSGILYTSSDNIIIENGARVNGSIYAERADITIKGVELDTRVIYTKRGDILINNGGKLGGVLVTGGDKLSISGGSKFDGSSGGIYAPEASVSIDQGASIIGKIVADSDNVNIKNINKGQSNYWLLSPGSGFDDKWNKKPVLIKEVIICSATKSPSFELYYRDDYGWKRVYPDSSMNGITCFYKDISSNRLLIRNPSDHPIKEIIIK